MPLAFIAASDNVIVVPCSRTVPHTLNVAGDVTVMWTLPVTLWYVARMSASPAATAVTNPVDEAVATPLLDDCQLAWLVTVCVVAFDMTAVAVNCDESPGLADEAGAVTVTELTVGAAGVVGVVGVLFDPPPQLTKPNAITTATKTARSV